MGQYGNKVEQFVLTLNALALGSIMKFQFFWIISYCMNNFASYNIFYVKIWWRCLNISNKEFQTNEEIQDSEVRLIGADGSQVGIVSLKQAKDMAYWEGLDLVKIADKAVPPVCKIIDYGKYKFDMAKNEKESRKNQRVVELKGIRLSMNIDENDLNTKLRHAKRFAENGDNIRVFMRLRGRENGHTDIGKDLMNNFAGLCSEFADVGKSTALEGKCLSMLLISKLNNLSKKNSKKGSEEGKTVNKNQTSSPEEHVQIENSQRSEEEIQNDGQRQDFESSC